MKKLKRISKIKFISLFYIVFAYFLVVLGSTYAFQQMSVSNSSSTGQGGCFQVNYTGQNLTSSDITSTNIYSEGAKATVTLSKNASCKIYTEANIYLKTNNTTTAPITTVLALKYKVFSGAYQISEGTVTSLNDYLLATVPLTDTATTYTVYLWVDNVISSGYYTDKTYSGYIYANSAQTSTIEGNYLVNFDLNNGSNLNLSKTVTNGQTYGWLPTPSKTGYTFDGWKLSSTSITSSTTVTETANHTLTAQWSTASYTVRFNANGGNVSPSSKTVTYGSTYGSLPTPTRGGSTFLGWHGKNLINYNDLLIYNNWKTDLVTNGSYSTNNGNRGFLLDVSVGVPYTISITTIGTDSSGVPAYLYLCKIVNSSGYLVAYLTTTSLSNSHYTFTPLAGETYFLRMGQSSSESSFNSSISKLTSIQLEKGSVATAYEPYYITSTTTVTRDEDHILYAMWG